MTDKQKAARRANYLRWIAKPGNRQIANARAVAHRRAHPEKRQMYEQRRRAMKLGRFVEDVDRHVLLGRHGGLCGWCGEPVGPNFHVDHIVAIVHGGEHSYANTQPVHPACNYEKRTILKERAA